MEIEGLEMPWWEAGFWAATVVAELGAQLVLFAVRWFFVPRWFLGA